MDRLSVFARFKGWFGSNAGLVFASVLVLVNGSFVYWKSRGGHEKSPARAIAQENAPTAPASKTVTASNTEEAGAFETPMSAAPQNHSAKAAVVATTATAPSREAKTSETKAVEPASDSPVTREPLFERAWAGYKGFFHSLQAKVDRIRSLESDNHRLELENANLRRWAEGLRFGCETKAAETETHKTGVRLSYETGAEMGRTLASIRYTPPANLLPKQLYALAVSYFKAKEDEKAAVIFTFLTGMSDDSSYQTPKNFLMTGVAWYRLDHWVEADAYFDRVIKAEPHPETLPFQAQARLWKALVAQRKNDRPQVQALLRDLMEKHPLSPEVEWVDHQPASRSIAVDSTLIESDQRANTEEEEHGRTSHSFH